MRVTGTPALPDSGSAPQVAPTPAVGGSSASTATAAMAPASTPAPLQSAVMQPALAALRDMPDIDHAKVAALRDALAKGELPFDAAKLAGLIARFHGGRA
jgi:negative regulator of flagellin synthesis FlgM